MALSDLWTSSRVIPATGSTAEIAANAPAPLGDVLEALLAQGGSLEVLAFGVLAQSSAPAVVASIDWNGVTYSFVPLLAASGADDVALPGAAAAAALLAGALLLLVRRRVARDRG